MATSSRSRAHPLKRRWRARAAALGLFLCGGAALAQPGEAERATLARQLEEAIAALHGLRTERAGTAEAHRERLARAERQEERLRGQAARLDAEIARERASVAALTSELAALRGREARALGTVQAATAAGSELLAGLEQRVRAGVPFDRERRLARLEAARAGLNSEEPAARAAGAQELLELLGDELRRARQVEYWNDDLQLGERRVHAYVLRLGLVGQAYLSEDGRELGLSSAEGEWIPAPAEHAAAVRAAFECLQGLRPPHIGTFPFDQPARESSR